MQQLADYCRCATPFGVDVVGITELIALIGALVGGLVARQRKQETERLNDQLRRINMQLRQQARSGTIYAPGLSYAPVPRDSVASAATSTEGAAASTATLPNPVTLSSTDEQTSPEQEACRDVLREGKRLLRSQQGMLGLPSIHKQSSLTRIPRETVPLSHASSCLPFHAVAATPPANTYVDVGLCDFSGFLQCVVLCSRTDSAPDPFLCLCIYMHAALPLNRDAGSAAIVRFEKALLMSQKLSDLLLQRRALRGLAASSRMQVSITNPFSYP